MFLKLIAIERSGHEWPLLEASFYKGMLDALPQPILVMDAKQLSIVFMNKEAIHKYGDVPYLTKCHVATHHEPQPCTGADHPCTVSEVTTSGQRSTLIHLHTFKSGEKRYVELSASPILDDHGQVAYVIEDQHDITERLVRQEQIQVFHEMVRNMPIAAITLDSNGSIITWNPAATSMFGHSKTKTKGTPITAWLPPSIVDQFRSFFPQSGPVETVAKLEKTITILGQPDRHLNLTVVPLQIPQSFISSAPALIVMFQDVTKQEKQERLDDYVRRLQSFIGDSLNNRLTSIMGYMAIAETENNWEFIASSHRALLNLSERIRMFQSISSMDFKFSQGLQDENQPFELRDVFTHIYQEVKINNRLRDYLGESIPVTAPIEIKYELLDSSNDMITPWIVNGDRLKLISVINELLLNSMEIMTLRKMPGNIVMRCREELDNIVLSIEDRGPGMSPVELNRYGTPFDKIQGMKTSSSVGLGAYMVKVFLRGMGHDINVVSKKDYGTTVTIKLRRESATI